jgi:hypothetical protein
MGATVREQAVGVADRPGETESCAPSARSRRCRVWNPTRWNYGRGCAVAPREYPFHGHRDAAPYSSDVDQTRRPVSSARRWSCGPVGAPGPSMFDVIQTSPC